MVELVALVWVIMESRHGDNIRADLAGFQWKSKEIIRDFVKISLPMLGSSLVWGVGFSLHSLIMGHLGSDAMAASSIANIAQELVTCVCKGISAGAGIMVGKQLGQNLFDQAKAYGKKFSYIALWTGVIHMVLLAVLAPIVSHYFVLSETARQYLICMLLFIGLYVFGYSVNTIVVCGVFPAGGDANYDAKSVFFASWCFALPLALIACFVLHLPVMAVYILMCSDEIVKLPFILPRCKKYLWVKNLTREELPNEKPIP